ncbi:hypothetical protein [Marinoscillum sp. MHG1-6]|uniref:hypothetical protein n=1 Tax=Marinoscillum sp. MHG1-6 TaxID=2959627 RepID=UPI0021584EFE|nr:hypothetical protein [Marinoscillum sp. MHG1-6]
MNIFQKNLGLKNYAKATENSKKSNDGTTSIPFSESEKFITHIETIKNEFDFLVPDFGFNLTKNTCISREHWTVYSKGPIEVEIMFESGSLPYVTIKNDKLPDDESKDLDNRDHVDHLNVNARQIRQVSTFRRGPIQKKKLCTNG